MVPTNSLSSKLAAVAALAISLGLGACRVPPTALVHKPSPPEPPTQVLTMDPVTLRQSGGKVIAEFNDAASLFDEADKLFREKKHAEALMHYERLLSLHPQSRYRMVALYNSGLALEKQNRPDEAAERYRKVIDENGRTRDAVDASFRLGECLTKSKKWRETADLFTSLLLRDDLKPADAFEARVRKGAAHSELLEEDEAERTLLRAARYHSEAARNESVYDPGLVAQAFFHLGEVARRRMAAAPLRLPQAQIELDLNAKGHLLLAAQGRFLRAIRTADAEWAPAAGHQLGLVYERFHADIMAAPIPPELNATEREVYVDELRKKVRPLISKAVGIYQRNLALSERLGAESPWISRTRERMEKLQQLLAEYEKRALQAPIEKTAAAAVTPKAEPVKAEPVKAEPVKAEPAKAEPVKAEPAKAEPAKAEPVKAEPVKAEPVKAEPVKAEPAKAEPAKAEPTGSSPRSGLERYGVGAT